ncbi:helix-turn-helix domain-containing protein [Brevibacillus borstelensis]|uniref:helix-turn-helix domain-containing protein n=1 Tax=Brevibacillus borstelensis TaxID=45462 RepID=UPI00148FD0CB|nr:helix-turn-helix domain-containing protein [Brevibacillus borstelensis]MCM3470989.1 helix-turn-helix domain-containing protein [Brevibacillus borstelensis]NOU58024.1 helix-turn-helix domain-containing protein [Brevibacillus borstelensis]
MNEFWLTYNRQAANEYMDKVAQESNFTSHHKGFTKVPHKIHRCYGLSQYEKLILIDLISYMSDKNKCYPTIETIARNIGCSSKSVERHIRELAKKKMILISQNRKNNEYYLPNNLHCHPYLLMSEKTHEFINGVRKQVNERELTKWVQEMVKSREYKEFTEKLQKLHERRFITDKFAEVEYLESYAQFLKDEFSKRFPSDVN